MNPDDDDLDALFADALELTEQADERPDRPEEEGLPPPF